MERTEALIVLEDELHEALWLARKASYLLQEIVDDFFCYTDTTVSPAAFEHLRGKYGRACAKADIVRYLLDETYKALDSLLAE